MSAGESFEGWAICELMGHRRLAGYVREVSMFGTSMLRLDVPSADGDTRATQFYSGAAVFCITPTTEEIARAMAKSEQPTPVQRWELPALPKPAAPSSSDAPVDDDEPARGDEAW